MNPEVIRARKLLIKIVIGIVVLVLLIVAFNFLMSGRIVLTMPENSNTAAIVITVADTGEEIYNQSTVEKKIDKRVKAGTYQVRVFTDDNRATSYTVKVGRFLTSTEVAVELSNQHSRDKLSRGAESCPVYVGDTLYSYNCYGVGPMYENTKLSKGSYPSRKEVTKLGPGVLKAQAYKQGMLVLRTEVGGEANMYSLSYFANGNLSTNKLPEEFEFSDGDLSFAVDSANGTGFVVGKDTNSKLAYFSDFNAEPSIVTADISTDVDPQSVASTVDLRDGKILIAKGTPDRSSDSEEEDETINESAESTIVSIAADGTKKESKIDGPVGKTLYCRDELVCILRENKLDVFKWDGDDLDDFTEIALVSDFTVQSNNSVMYAQENKLYSSDLSTFVSKLAFASSNFNISSLSNTPGKNGIIMNAFTEDGNISHTFQVSAEPAASNDFLDSRLPYRAKEFGYVRDSDYTNRLIVVDVSLDSWSNNPGGPLTYDKQEFETKKLTVLADLKKNGITPDEFTIEVQP